jgi:hypothetical protein
MDKSAEFRNRARDCRGQADLQRMGRLKNNGWPFCPNLIWLKAGLIRTGKMRPAEAAYPITK